MKILHIVPTYIPAWRYGGPIHSVHGLCKALVAQGHEVHVFTTNVDGESDSEVPLNEAVDIDGVKVWYFPSRVTCGGKAVVDENCGRRAPAANGFINRITRRLYYSKQMKKALQSRAREFDIIHLHSVFLWPTWAAARVAYSLDVPYVLSPRGMLVKDLVQRKSRWIKTAWLRFIEKKNIEQAAALHVTSDEESRELSTFNFKISTVFTLANGVDKPKRWQQDALSDDIARVISIGEYVLYFGRLNWKKGIDRLLRTWDEAPHRKLVIAGNDEEDYLQTLYKVAAESGIEDRVTFIPRSIAGTDKEALLQSASLLVLPSYSENFGNVVPEAMIRGVPVVVTEEVGAKGIVEAAAGGVVTNADSLGVVIDELFNNPQQLSEMSRNGKQWVAENLSWDKVAAEMADRYVLIVGK